MRSSSRDRGTPGALKLNRIIIRIGRARLDRSSGRNSERRNIKRSHIAFKGGNVIILVLRIKVRQEILEAGFAGLLANALGTEFPIAILLAN